MITSGDLEKKEVVIITFKHPEIVCLKACTHKNNFCFLKKASSVPYTIY